MASLIDPLYKIPVVAPRSLGKEQDALEKEHAVAYTGDSPISSLAARINRALRDRKIARPGHGRWVEYITPDLRRIYVESTLRKAYLGRIPDKNITARVVIKPGGLEYTNDLHSLIMMRMIEVSGDMLDVARTADVVGIQVSDSETRSEERAQREKRSSLAKEAVSAMSDVPSDLSASAPGAGSSLLSFPKETTHIAPKNRIKKSKLLREFRRLGVPSYSYGPPGEIGYTGARGLFG